MKSIGKTNSRKEIHRHKIWWKSFKTSRFKNTVNTAKKKNNNSKTRHYIVSFNTDAW